MQFKPLSAEGRFECGFNEIVEGKIAALAVVGLSEEPGGWGLGIALANEDGYHAVPAHWCHGDDHQSMTNHARALNKELFGHDDRQAALIIASTMFRNPSRNRPRVVMREHVALKEK